MAVASIAHAHVPVRVIVGVDTHKDSHVGHAKDGLGRDLGHLEVPSTARGYASLLARATSLLSVWRGPAATASDSPDTCRAKAS